MTGTVMKGLLPGLLASVCLALSSCASVSGDKDLCVPTEPGVYNVPAVSDVLDVSTVRDVSTILNVSTVTAVSADPVTILFGGDVTLDWGYHELVPQAYDDPGWPFHRLKTLIDEADVFMLNCENPITEREDPQDKQFTFQMDPRLIEAFTEGGVDIVTLANNHIMDHGPVGLEDTLNILDDNGIAHVGAGMDLTGARYPALLNAGGRRIAFLAYGNYSPAGADKPGVAYRYPRYISQDVRAAKQYLGADIIVVNFHWGVELEPEPTERDRKLAYLAIDSGADIVVGHHPHVVQPVEIYKGKVIAFSLSNFIFGGNSKRPKDSILLKVTVSPDGMIEHEVIPIRIFPEETRYQPYVLNTPE